MAWAQYSTISLTFGPIVSFWIGRWLGEHTRRNLVSKETWQQLGFIVGAEAPFSDSSST